VVESNERRIEVLSTTMEFRCFRLLSSSGFFECCQPLCDVP